MKKPGRNDPCPCGSGKKYKHCCLKTEETQVVSASSGAVPKAIDWLFTMHGPAVREAMDDGFFGGLDDEEYKQLKDQHPDSFEGIMINALEWLLADGVIAVKGQEHRVSELLLARGGPLFSVEQQQWIKLLATKPLRLYEVTEAVQGKSMHLKDVLLPESTPVLVQEKAGSQQAIKFDLIAARIVPLESHFVLSGGIYAFPRHRSFDLIAELRSELEGVDPDSALAKEITSVIIPDHWLKLFTTAFEIPQLVDYITGNPILLITDHYRVHDWLALEQALSSKTDVKGGHEEGWSRVFEGSDGQVRRSLSIDPSKRSDQIKVSYRTQQYADTGRPWFESIAGTSVAFVSREISDPKGILSNKRPGEVSKPSATAQMPPEELTEFFEKHIRQFYQSWADKPVPVLDNKTPREAITTEKGLEQVKFLLHSYENNEAQQANEQHRAPVSYDFLWQELGIAP